MRDPFTSVRVVSLTDPALDMTPEELERYAKSREEKLVKVRAGCIPCWFTIQRIDALFAMVVVDSYDNPGMRAVMAFRAGVAEVALPGGEKLLPELEKREGVAFGAQLAVEGWPRLVAERVGARRVKEIGAVAARLAMLDDEAHDPLLGAPGPAPTS